MTGELQPETTSGIPAPIAAKRPAIEITIRFDTDQLAELAGLMQGSPAESSPVPVMPSTGLTGTEANLPAVTPDPMPPPKRNETCTRWFRAYSAPTTATIFRMARPSSG